MAVPNISLPGAINNGMDDLEQFLIVFSGEVQSAFVQATITGGTHQEKRLDFGKSAQFPGHGRATARPLPRGVNLLTDNAGTSVFNVSEALVAVDRPYVADTFVDKHDDDMNHWETRQRYADELGQSIARYRDYLAFRAILRAGRTASPSNLIPTDLGDALGAGGYVGSLPVVGTRTPAELLEALIGAAQIFDEKSVPRDGRRIAPVRPSDYWLLVRNTDLLNRDYGNEGNGVYADGEVMRAAGLQLRMTNLLPTDNLTTNPDGLVNTYTGDATELVSPVYWWDAIGSVIRMDPDVETEYKMEVGGYPIIAKMSGGTAPVRPASVVEIGENASQPAL